MNLQKTLPSLVFTLGISIFPQLSLAETTAAAGTSATITSTTMAPAIPGTKEVSGVVRLIRGSPETEVFFKDLKDSVIIPKTSSKHNQIFAACETSMKKGTPVKLLIDPVSRQARGLPEDKPASATSGEAAPAKSSASESTGFKEIPEDGAK